MKYILLFIIAASFCFSCNNTTTTTTTTFDSTSTVITAIDPKRELFVLDSVLKQYETPMQHFKASYAHPMKIKGAKGTIISVEPADLVTASGKPMNASIDIELKELTTTEELARDRAATVSDGKLLVSGGAYYLNMTCAGEQLKLKEGKALKVQFPKITNDDMSLFYGQRDSLGQMNWKETGLSLGSSVKRIDNKEDTADFVDVQKHYEGNKNIGEQNSNNTAQKLQQQKEYKAYEKKQQAELDLAEKMYRVVEIQNFGWINCDRFLGKEIVLTNLTISFDRTDTVNYVNAYLVFSSINSIMNEVFQLSSPQKKFVNVPVGAKVLLVVVGVRGEKVFTHKSQITISQEHNLIIKLKETPEKNITDLFKS